ncbi:MAG: hypothetical protein K6G38_01325 [Gammaproteobacteria bacterium]|nr:hypothetical protein [Gammaproteobacteria bacterium]
MKTNTIKQVTFLVGGLLVIAAGLFYILMADLYLHATSIVLFLGVIPSVFGGIFFILSENFKNKKHLFFIFKAIGIVLTLLFILYLFAVSGQDKDVIAEYTARGEANLNFIEKIKLQMYNAYNTNTIFKFFKTYDGKTIFATNKNFKNALTISFSHAWMHVTLIVLSFVSIVTQAFNTIFNAVTGVEE